MCSKPSFLFALFVFAIATSASAEDTNSKEFQKYLKAESEYAIEAMTISLGTPPAGKAKLKVRKEPVLNWSNNRNGYYGGKMYVWQRGERPLALTGTFHWPAKNQMVFEFINLSPEPMFADFEANVVWNGAQKNAVRWQPLDASSPAKSPTVRLAQMRNLARKFTARAIKGPPQYEPDSRWELRLVPNPLYRYQPKKSEVVDGAIFSFALETDPELLLMLEARSDDNGKLSWHFAAARACAWELQLDYRKSRAWTTKREFKYPLPQGFGFYQFKRDMEYPELK